MTGSKDLKSIVAELAGCDLAEINADFSLDRPGLEGSLRRAILIASIRRHLGKDCMQAGRVKTFGELEAAVETASQGPAVP